MTNGWIDIKNTDMMLIMGGNPAENHPCGFKWPIEAKRQRNAKMIVVDPRFTRTAATADLFLQIRAGADIAWDDAIDEISRWVKTTRDATFVEKDTRGRTVNRCEGIAWTGGCTDTNELNYLVVKTMRSLGVVYLENQARV